MTYELRAIVYHYRGRHITLSANGDWITYPELDRFFAGTLAGCMTEIDEALDV